MRTGKYLALVAVSLLASFVCSASHRVALRPTLLIAVALIVLISVAAPQGIFSHLHHLQMPVVQKLIDIQSWRTDMGKAQRDAVRLHCEMRKGVLQGRTFSMSTIQILKACK